MHQVGIKKNFILSTLYQVLTMLTPFITAPYVSRILESDGVGIYSFTFSVQMYFSLFAALGTASYGSREIAIERNDKERYSKLFWEIELLSVLTTFLTLILWGWWLLIARSNKLYYIILSLNILAVAFDISWLFTGLEQFQYIVYRNSIFKLLSIAAIFLFIKQKDDLPIYFLIMVLSTLASNMSMWISLPKFVTKVDISTLQIKKHFKETMIYFIPTISTSIYTVLDKTLIGVITKNESENGYYEQATKIVNMAKTFSFVSLNSILGSRISYLYSEKKYDEIKFRIERSINYITFISFGLCFGIIGVSTRFVPLFFGKGYERVIPILCLLTPVILIIGISNCLGSHYYTPVGLRKQSARYIITGSFVNLICNIILIPKLWSYGAVIGTLVAETTITVLYLLHCDHYLETKTLLRVAWKKMVAGVVMLAIILLINLVITNDIIALLTEFLAGITVYCSVLVLLKDDFFIHFLLDFIKNILINIKNKM